MKITTDKMLPMEWFDRLRVFDLNCSESETEVLMTTFYEKVTSALLDRMPRLRLVVQFGVGYDNIDVAACTARGILVTNTPHPVIEPTAELCMGLMIALVRRISELDRGLKTGYWDGFGLMHNMGHTLYGKTLGIIGMGNIGRSVARRALANGMHVLYHNRHAVDASLLPRMGSEVAEYVSQEELLERSDVVSLNLPYTADVRHLIGEAELRMMKSDAYLINTARGAHVDEAVLLRALEEGWIAGAALDVYEHEPVITEGLKRLNNCLLVPHIGTATWECRKAMADAMIENILAYADGRIDDMTIVNRKELIKK